MTRQSKALNQRNDKKTLCTIVILIIMLIGLTRCKGQAKNEKENPESGATPAAFMITQDNYFDYQRGMECSAFASAYLLRFFGEEAEGMALFEDFPHKAPDGGVMPYGIETFFQERGFHAEYNCNGTLEDLKAQIALGIPVIVFIHISEPTATLHHTHYVPVVGYDEDYLYLAESIPELANSIEEAEVPYNRRIEHSRFMVLWENIDGIWDYPYYTITRP